MQPRDETKHQRPLPRKQVLRHQLLEEISSDGKLDAYVNAGILPFSIKSNYLAYKVYLDCLEKGESPKQAIIEMTIQTNYSERRAYQIVQQMEQVVVYYA